MTVNRNMDAESAAAQPGTNLVYLGADWCGYCQFTKPAIEELADEGVEGINSVTVINSDDDPMSSLFLKMKTLPQVVIFRDGQELARRGSGRKDELKAWLDEQLAA